MIFRASLPLAAVLLMPLACVPAPERAEADKAEAAKTEAAKPNSKPNSTASTELSAEELELIAADSKSLTPEQNRKRAFALRKQIMQNPDSPQAKALEDARASALEGQLTLEQVKPDANAPAPAPAPDPGLIIELPEHLQNQDVSFGGPPPKQ